MSGNKKYLWFVVTPIVAGILCLGVWLTLWATPEPLTGDREADAACAALTEAVLDPQGRLSKQHLITLPQEEKRRIAEKIARHAERSEIPAFQDVSLEIAVASRADDSLFGVAQYVTALGTVAQTCAEHGWNAREAGLYDGE